MSTAHLSGIPMFRKNCGNGGILGENHPGHGYFPGSRSVPMARLQQHSSARLHPNGMLQEIDAMPSYPILRESFSHENAREIVSSLGASNPTDGIRVADEDGWYLIRASGTEPKIRITAEGKNLKKAKEMLSKGRDLIRQGKTA